MLPEADPIEEEEEEEEEEEQNNEKTKLEVDDKMLTKENIEQIIVEQQENKSEETITEFKAKEDHTVVIDAETAIAINSALVASSLRNKNLSENHAIVAASSNGTAGQRGVCVEQQRLQRKEEQSTISKTEVKTDDEQQERYDYVVDRNYGVEV